MLKRLSLKRDVPSLSTNNRSKILVKWPLQKLIKIVSDVAQNEQLNGESKVQYEQLVKEYSKVFPPYDTAKQRQLFIIHMLEDLLLKHLVEMRSKKLLKISDYNDIAVNVSRTLTMSQSEQFVMLTMIWCDFERLRSVSYDTFDSRLDPYLFTDNSDNSITSESDGEEQDDEDGREEAGVAIRTLGDLINRIDRANLLSREEIELAGIMHNILQYDLNRVKCVKNVGDIAKKMRIEFETRVNNYVPKPSTSNNKMGVIIDEQPFLVSISDDETTIEENVGKEAREQKEEKKQIEKKQIEKKVVPKRRSLPGNFERVTSGKTQENVRRSTRLNLIPNPKVVGLSIPDKIVITTTSSSNNKNQPTSLPTPSNNTVDENVDKKTQDVKEVVKRDAIVVIEEKKSEPIRTRMATRKSLCAAAFKSMNNSNDIDDRKLMPPPPTIPSRRPMRHSLMPQLTLNKSLLDKPIKQPEAINVSTTTTNETTTTTTSTTTSMKLRQKRVSISASSRMSDFLVILPASLKVNDNILPSSSSSSSSRPMIEAPSPSKSTPSKKIQNEKDENGDFQPMEVDENNNKIAIVDINATTEKSKSVQTNEFFQSSNQVVAYQFPLSRAPTWGLTPLYSIKPGEVFKKHEIGRVFRQLIINRRRKQLRAKRPKIEPQRLRKVSQQKKKKIVKKVVMQNKNDRNIAVVPTMTTRNYKPYKDKSDLPVSKISLNLILDAIFLHRHARLVENIPENREIRNHMDLAKIRRRVQSGEVKTIGKFQRDIMLMFTNILILPKKENIRLTLEMVREMFEYYLTEIVPMLDQTNSMKESSPQTGLATSRLKRRPSIYPK